MSEKKPGRQQTCGCGVCRKCKQRECMANYRRRVHMIGSDIKDIIWPSPWDQDAAMQAAVLSRYICPLSKAVEKAPAHYMTAGSSKTRNVTYKEDKHGGTE